MAPIKRNQASGKGNDIGAPPASGTPTDKPTSIHQTEIWQASKRGVLNFWGNYKSGLAGAFKNMARADQENLVVKFSVIGTVGVTVLALVLFYNFILVPVRVLLVPAALGGAWWAGRAVVSPVVLARLEPILNRE